VKTGDFSVDETSRKNSKNSWGRTMDHSTRKGLKVKGVSIKIRKQ
jgi:hypothetical protein